MNGNLLLVHSDFNMIQCMDGVKEEVVGRERDV